MLLLLLFYFYFYFILKKKILHHISTQINKSISKHQCKRANNTTKHTYEFQYWRQTITYRKNFLQLNHPNPIVGCWFWLFFFFFLSFSPKLLREKITKFQYSSFFVLLCFTHWFFFLNFKIFSFLIFWLFWKDVNKWKIVWNYEMGMNGWITSNCFLKNL